jgi:hypothetical protein
MCKRNFLFFYLLSLFGEMINLILVGNLSYATAANNIVMLPVQCVKPNLQEMLADLV